MRDHGRPVLLAIAWGLVLLGGASSVAVAAPTGPPMPWDGPLYMILASLSGTVAHVLVTVAVIVTGLVFAFTEHGSGARRLFGVAFGGALRPRSPQFHDGGRLGGSDLLMDEPRRAPIHPSLTRPLLLGGAERELVMVNGTLIASLVFGVGFHWVSLIVASLLATGGHWALTRAAKYDAQLSRIYIRHVRYQPYYPARPVTRARPAWVYPRGRLMLAVFTSKPRGLADLLSYAALVDKGICLLKDGGFWPPGPIRGPISSLQATRSSQSSRAR